MKNRKILKMFLLLCILTSCSNNSPYIGDNGNWYIDGNDMGIKAEGKDGQTPSITIGDNGNWFINGVDTNIKAQGEKGETGPIGATGENGPQGPSGEKGEQGPAGENGNGILNITLTSSNDLIDTYTISYTNGTFSTFNVVNGNDGLNGITPLFKVENDCLLVSYDNGEYYKNLGNIKGLTGEKGNDGITPLFKVENDCLLVSYDNGEYYKNLGNIKGTSGEKGDDGITPLLKINSKSNEWEVSYDNGSSWTSLNVKATGENGQTPKISIGENGNWFINNIDSGMLALGQKGETGSSIKDINVQYEIDENNNEYNVFTFTFTDDSIQPITKKVLIPTRIVSGGHLVTSDYVVLDNNEQTYDLEISVKYNNGTTANIPLKQEYIKTNTIDFYNDGCYTLTYEFLNETYTYDICVLSKRLYEYKLSIIDSINKSLDSYYYIDDETKQTCNNIIDKLNKAYNELTIDKLNSEYLTIYDSNNAVLPFNVDAITKLYYFDSLDSVEIQEQSIINYDGKYEPSTCCYYTYNETQFEVVSSSKGVVSDIKQDELYGNVIIITNDDIEYTYSSVDNIRINIGDEVFPGQVIANASTCNKLESYGVGLCVSIKKNSNLINPRDIYLTNFSNDNLENYLTLKGYVIKSPFNEDSGFYLYTNYGTIFVYDNGKSNVSNGDKITLNGKYKKYVLNNLTHYEIDITKKGSYIKMIKNNNTMLSINNYIDVILGSTSNFQTTKKELSEQKAIYHTNAYLFKNEDGTYKLCSNFDGTGNSISFYQSNSKIDYYYDSFKNIINDGNLYDFYFVIIGQNNKDSSYSIVPLFYN